MSYKDSLSYIDWTHKDERVEIHILELVILRTRNDSHFFGLFRCEKGSIDIKLSIQYCSFNDIKQDLK